MHKLISIIHTIAASAKSLFVRWWLLLILAVVIALINAHIMGRGWGVSMLTCKRCTGKLTKAWQEQ